MIRLPDIPALSGSPVDMPGVRAAALGAPAAALTGLGRQLTEVSGEFFDTAIQMQKLKNARTVSEKRMGLQSEWAALALELEKDPDPENMIRRTQEFFQSKQGTIDDPELPPAVRDEMGQFYADFSHKNTIAMSERAANKEIKRATYALDNEIDAAVSNNDMAGAEGAITRMVSAGVLLPEQAEGMKRKVGQQIAINGHQSAIMADASTWLQQHPRDTIPDGMEPDTYRQLHTMAESEMRGQTADDIAGALDVLHSGKAIDEETFSKSIAHLKPSVQARLKNEWLDKQASDYKARINSPEYQNEVVGRVSGMIAEYNPEADGYDDQLVAIDAEIRTLPEGHPVRNELKRQLAAKQDGIQKQVTTRLDQGLEAIDQAADRGDFGPLKAPTGKPVETRKAVADGFLKDTAKLKALGFSPDQAEDIREAARKGPAAGQTKFNELWKERPQDSINAQPYDIAVAYALTNENAFLKWDSDVAPEQIAEHESAIKAKGEAIMEYTKWITANPNASEADIGAKLRELGSKSARVAPRTGPVKPPPARPGSETSMLPKPLAPLAPAFQEAGKKHGIDPRLLMAISMHETANGTSSAYRNKKNAMGVSDSKGPVGFDDPAASVEQMARVLTSPKGPYKNARTLAEIGKVYAPSGAGNDPRGLNSHWVSGVSKYLRQLGGDPDNLFTS